ncbi:4267_t:CDS:1, partial [Gigaspora margarita]
FENLLKFIPANYSTYQLESSFNSLSELIDRTNPVNIIMGISSFYDRIVIDLNHNDDKENEVFLNATLPFEQFVFMNYLSYNNSLSLRSTSDSLSSRPHTRRFIERYFLAGEGVVTTVNGQLAVRCSAGFSAIDNTTYKKYIITSARCLPELNMPIYHAPWEQQLPLVEAQLDYFGYVMFVQRSGVDVALIEKFNSSFKLTPMMRSSVNDVKQIIIDKFNNGGFEIPEGYNICISGYETEIKCGLVTSSYVHAHIRSIRQGVRNDNYYKMLRAEIRVSNQDIGGTVFSIEIPDDGPDEGIPILVVHGIVTYGYGGIVTIQPLSGMTNFGPISPMFTRLRFIDLGIFRQLQQ